MSARGAVNLSELPPAARAKIEATLGIKPLGDLSSDELSLKISTALEKVTVSLAELKPLVEEAWRRLAAGETVSLCTTKTEFAEKVLGKSLRAVQYMLAGGNANRTEYVRPPEDVEDETDETAEEEPTASAPTRKKTVPLHERYEALKKQNEDLQKAFNEIARSRPTITPAEKNLLNAYLYGRIAEGHEERLLALGLTQSDLTTFRRVARAVIPHQLRDKIRSVWGVVEQSIPSQKLLPENATGGFETSLVSPTKQQDNQPKPTQCEVQTEPSDVPVHIVAQYILQGRGWDSEGSDTSLPVSAEEQTARRVLYWYSKNRVRVQGLQVVHGRDAQANTEREVFFEQLEGFIKHKWHADDRQPHAYIRNSLKQDAEAQIAA